MKKKRLLSSLVLLFLFSSICFAEVTVDKEIPYRIYYDECFDWQWVDVRFILDDNLDVVFQDDSPIIEIYQCEWFDKYIIIKEKSKWIFEISPSYKSGMREKALTLIEPVIEEQLSWELIYKANQHFIDRSSDGFYLYSPGQLEELRRIEESLR